LDDARKRLEVALIRRRKAGLARGAAQWALADAEAEVESAEAEVKEAMGMLSLMLVGPDA